MTDHDARSREVIEEHRRLRKDLAELSGALAGPPSSGGHREWVGRLSERIGSLRERLARHFEEEVASGFFDQIERAWPNAAPRCRGFLEDHGRLLDRMDAILRSAREDASSDETVEKLAREARSLTEALRTHEARETELFQTAIEGGPGALD